MVTKQGRRKEERKREMGESRPETPRVPPAYKKHTRRSRAKRQGESGDRAQECSGRRSTCVMPEAGSRSGRARCRDPCRVQIAISVAVRSSRSKQTVNKLQDAAVAGGRCATRGERVW